MNIRGDTTLVLGDTHVDPRQDNVRGLRRFDWAGRLINDIQPNNLVIIGDFLSMQSLSHWDMDKRQRVEGKRYSKDIAAGNHALDLLDARISTITNKYFIFGNHEDWVRQYVETHPEVEGQLDLAKDLRLEDRGYKITPYKDDVKIQGVSFTHVPIMANGKPVGGKYASAKALDVYSNSVVFGHTHQLDVACVHRKNSTSLQQSINVGCFFEHIDEYAQGSQTNYWRGLVLLEHYDRNRVDIETFALGKLRRMYGQN